MRFLNLFGSMPSLITENTRPWDWMGHFRLSIDPAQIRFLDILGSGGDFFDAVLNRQLGAILVTPIARPDFEAFARAGLDTSLSLTLRFFMADGTIAQSLQSWIVTLLDQDDAPPDSLVLTTGGAVPFGVPGAPIGTLAVHDPDTASGFTFAIREDDAWLFEVVGNTLRLKPGMVLSEADGPLRAVTIEVSDGLQSSAFTVTFNVTDPRAPAGQLANLLVPGREHDGFSWRGGTLMADVASSQVEAIRDYGALLNITLRDGGSVWVDQPGVIDMIDGRVFFGAAAPLAARVWNIYETAIDREPTLKEMQALHAWLEEGRPADELSRMAVQAPQLKRLSNEQFVRRLYDNAVDWQDEGGVAYHVGRLNAGLGRDRLFTEFLNWRESMGHEAARAEHGFFVPRPQAHQVDILLKYGAGIETGAATRWWVDQISSGKLTLATLAGVVTGLDGHKASLVGHDAWSYVAEFYREALGQAMPLDAVRAWGSGLLAGSLSVPAYLEAVAGGVTLAAFSSSYVFERPDGGAFASPWF